MKVIDLFAGVGGLSQGFIAEGFDVVYANEYDESIAKAYKYNHPKTIVDTTDITKVQFEKVFKKYRNKITVVMGGPPCQGFSQKGKRIGLDDKRNFMFEKFARVVEVVSPEFFVLENVPNILTSESGYFRDQIIERFARLGYDVKTGVLKAEGFGVPQTRRRAVFLGRKGKLNIQIPIGNGKVTTVIDAIGDLPKLKSGQGDKVQSYLVDAQNSYQKMMRMGSKAIYNHTATKHSLAALARLKYVKLNTTRADLPDEHKTKSIHSGTWTRLKPNGFARTITTRFDTPSSGQFTLPYQDRCITVREAARLQSFPDRFIFLGNKSSQMLQVGNAVPPILAQALAKTIKKALSDRPVKI